MITRKFTVYFFISLSCICIISQDAGAQTDEGLVTYKLGTDTTVSQYFKLDKGKFNTTILLLTGQIQKFEGLGELDADGDIKKVRSKSFQLDSAGKWFMSGEATNIFTGDSSVYRVMVKDKVVYRRAVPAKGIVSNAADVCSFYVFPYMGFFAPSKTGDTLFHCQLSFGECRKFQVARLEKNELKIGSGVMGQIKLFVDENNRMTGADAIGSSLNFIATVEREKKDYNEYFDQLAQRRFAKGNFTPATKRDTAIVLVNNKKLEIDYWRPLRRNREIFGTVVPWNRIWRTGANNATRLRTTSDVDFSGNKIPGGKYSVWTYPTETGWKFILNKKADVWGTEYDSTANILEIPMTIEKVAAPVEILKISLIPQRDNIVKLLIEWEYYKAWINFMVE